MGKKSLAEAIILQSMEDLWEPSHRQHSLDFFSGEGFEICSGMAGLTESECQEIFKLLNLEIKKTRWQEPELVGKKY